MEEAVVEEAEEEEGVDAEILLQVAFPSMTCAVR